ncbi:GSCFA domain-containing protein [Hymenobacter nivis]|nr:GSCFA domain-containing protein [Hymenobacter nivis]
MAQQLPPSARVLTLGSCFADSIGARLAAHKVNVVVNPFGTVFQPLAMGRLLRAALGEDVDWQQHLVEARGRWQSYDLHGSQGAPTPVELLHDIQQTVRRTGEFLRGADAVLLTLGTAWAYRLRETGELVSNCHKMPAELFEKELLTPDEIINALAETHAYLRRINPKLRVILTVSPVRHLRDTLPLNAVSKSVLRVACHYLSELLPEVSYFPAYELLADDLRDYRFYAADMLHPSEVAEDYIWEKFARTYFDADFGRFRKEWAGLSQALGHRPLNAAAPEHRQFLVATRERLERLSRQRVNVAAELREVDERLATLPVPADVVTPGPELDAEERVDVGNAKTVEALSLTEAAASADGALATNNERHARLSPEEFRAQRAARNNRPGRGRREDRNADPNAEQPAADAAATADAVATADLAAPFEAFDDSAVETPPAVEGAELDPAKKKKRRSRGGAKRTARKNAAKLAADGDDEGLAPTEPDATAEGGPALPRNPQPEARKSSVITKSVPVKRGGRGRDRSQDDAAPVETMANGYTPASTQEAAVQQPDKAPQPSINEPVAQAATAADESMTSQADRTGNRRNQGPKTRPLFATLAQEAPGASDTSEATPVDAVSQPAPAAAAKKPSRRRPSLMTETPPMTPIVPIRTAPQVGVAAGRMRGSDATLIASVPAKKALAPKAAVSKAAAPKATAPKAADVPKAAAPNKATPKATMPKASVKEVAVPKVAAVTAPAAAANTLTAKAPKATAPKGSTPKAVVSKAKIPKTAAPKATAPKADKPKVKAPKATPKAKAPTLAPAPPEAPAPAAKRPAKPRAKKDAGSPE